MDDRKIIKIIIKTRKKLWRALNGSFQRIIIMIL